MILIVSKDTLWTKTLKDTLVNSGFVDFSILDDSNATFYIDNWDPKDIEYIIFFHYSKIVPNDILNRYKCVGVHTSNLPKGRGGSPIQNQIRDNIISTHVNLIKMIEGVDQGDIYLRAPCTLQGSIVDIMNMIAKITAKLILRLIETKTSPTSQDTLECETHNLTELYKRIKNNQIDITNETITLEKIYDEIRMVDSEEYPNAYIDIGDIHIEFSRAKLLKDGRILCDAIINELN